MLERRIEQIVELRRIEEVGTDVVKMSSNLTVHKKGEGVAEIRI